MLRKPFVRSAYNYDADEVSKETGLVCDESVTRQEFKDECDINTLLRRFAITGELPQGVRMPVYADFSEVSDFHSAANAIALAHEAFDVMPAEVRERFQNDPGRFVDFCLDDKNRPEAERLGLVPPVPVVSPPAVQAAGAKAPAVGAGGSSASSSGAAPAVPASEASSSTLPT